jgi:hypothetical protein
MLQPILKAIPAFALSVLVLSPPAIAQVFDIKTRPVIIQPSVRIMPHTNVYTAPQRLIRVPATTVTRSIVVTPSNTPEVTTTVTSTLTKFPQFAPRLANMKDQINLGASRGWLTGEEVAQLNSEYNRLDSLLHSHEVGGLTNLEIDDLEKQFTLFNQVIASELNDRDSAVAGTQVVPY